MSPSMAFLGSEVQLEEDCYYPEPLSASRLLGEPMREIAAQLAMAVGTRPFGRHLNRTLQQVYIGIYWDIKVWMIRVYAEMYRDVLGHIELWYWAFTPNNGKNIDTEKHDRE